MISLLILDPPFSRALNFIVPFPCPLLLSCFVCWELSFLLRLFAFFSWLDVLLHFYIVKEVVGHLTINAFLRVISWLIYGLLFFFLFSLCV